MTAPARNRVAALLLILVHLQKTRAPGQPEAQTAVVDDLLIEGSGGESVLRLLGSGFPAESGFWEAHYLRVRAGWERALARLKVFLEKNMDREAT